MRLLDHEADELWIDHARYESICSLFDEFDAFLDKHPAVGLGMLAVREHLDARFDQESLREYRTKLVASKAHGRPELFAKYIEGEHYAADAHANYEA